jgi:hypothetical protein
MIHYATIPGESRAIVGMDVILLKRYKNSPIEDLFPLDPFNLNGYFDLDCVAASQQVVIFRQKG